jgi:hypothetical protein
MRYLMCVLCLVFLLSSSGCEKAIDALGEDPQVTVKNDSSSTVGNFFERSCGSTSWNRIGGGGGGIKPNSEYTYEVEKGCHDFKAELTTGQELDWMDVELKKNEEYTLTIYDDF